MNVIIIESTYMVFGMRMYRSGEFKVNSRLYKEYPDLEASKAANNWIKQLKSEHGEIELIEVKYEGKDITNLCKANEKLDIDDVRL